MKEYVALATVDSQNYQDVNTDLLKTLVNEQKTPGVYVTMNKPFKTLKSLFDKEGINTKIIIFIDAVTESSRVEMTQDCLFIGNPEKLSDISIAMDQAVRAITFDEKFVFFDSLSTLLIYNNPNTIAKFIHFLSTKMREWKVKGIIISLERDNKQLIDKLIQFCDLSFDFK